MAPGQVEKVLDFVKMNPSGNITLIVTSHLSRKLHVKAGLLLIGTDYLSAEQVGFLEKPADSRASGRLQMMGGEFCGNASRAMAALLMDKTSERVEKLQEGQEMQVLTLEVSGCENLVPVAVTPLNDRKWWTEMQVPSPRSVEKVEVLIEERTLEAFRVSWPGIEHLVLENINPAEEIYKSLLDQKCFKPGSEARGVMFYNPATSVLIPLVAVGDNPPIWEGSCGSGSTAVAVCQAFCHGSSINNLVLKQPKGEITVDVEYLKDKVNRLVIKGTVEKIAEGQVFLPDL